MDRQIVKKKKPLYRMYAIVAVLLTSGFIAYKTYDSGGSKTHLRIGSDAINVNEVKLGEIQEYIPVSGTILAKNTVFLDLKAGGSVELIAVPSGKYVEKGDLILKLSNPVMQKENIDSESLLLQNLDMLRASEADIIDKNLKLKEDVAKVEFDLQIILNKYNRYKKLLQAQSDAITREEFESVENELQYMRKMKALLEERKRQEKQYYSQQLEQIASSVARVRASLEVLANISDSINVRAPIDGLLSSMSAEVGQHFDQGARIGQVDESGGLKIRADVDQYYVSRVSIGQTGTFFMDNKTYEVVIEKIFPEVKNNTFRVDMTLVGEVSENIKRGQTVQLKLALNSPVVAKVIPKGSFYNFTNGRWVYRITKDGSRAEKVVISTGIQNPLEIEIIEGLEVGDQVISSNYEAFNNVDELIFSSAIN